MGQRRGYDRWDEPPSEQIGLGSLEILAIFGKAKKAEKLFRAQPPGPIHKFDVITGKEVISMPKTLKHAPAEEEIEDQDEGEESDEDETPTKKDGRGNPGNLTPREPVKVPEKVKAGVSDEVRKLLKQRDKLLAAGDQKGLRKVRAALRKAGFRLSNYAGKDDKIANAAKAKVKAKPAAAAEAEEEEED